MAKDYRSMASQVIEKVGGAQNIESVTHCVTRLRFVLKDEGIVDDSAVKAIAGVKGVAKAGGQYQVIVGTDVKDAFIEVDALLGNGKSAAEAMKDKVNKTAPGKKDNLFNRFCKTISGIIMPFIPALTGAGLLKALLTILTLTGVLSAQSGTYQLLYAGADAFFYFLPIMCAFSAGKKFGASPYVCAALAAALVYPNIITAYNDGAHLTFLGIPVTLMSYTNGIFPAMAGAWLAAQVEKLAKKMIPDVVYIFRPFITLLITVPVTFLVIGPVFTMVSNGLAGGSKALYAFSPIICGLLIGGLWQLVVIFGLHYAFIPILINNIATMGKDPINALMGVTVFAVSGAAIGFGLKMRDKQKRADGFSTGLTGLLGITEPLIFGILLPYKKPFIAAIIAGAVGGVINAAMGGCMFGFGGGGLANAAFNINPDGSMGTLLAYAVSGLVALAGAAVLCFFMMKGDEKLDA